MTPESPEAHIVDRQIDAYNRRDLEGFLSHYADSVDLLVDGRIAATGKEALRAAYAQQFGATRAEARTVTRTSHGEWVVETERLSVEGAPPAVVLALYRVREGLIDQVQFLGQRAA